MVIKSIPVNKSGQTPFGPLPTSSPSIPNLQKEAKLANNLEKGKAADERYLGEQQNLAQRALKFAQTGEAPWDDVDPEDPLNYDTWMED